MLAHLGVCLGCVVWWIVVGLGVAAIGVGCCIGGALEWRVCGGEQGVGILGRVGWAWEKVDGLVFFFLCYNESG